MKIIKHIIPILIYITISYSCTDDVCVSETETYLSLEFNITDEVLIGESFLDSLSIYSPEWTDSIHYWEDGENNIISFMLSPNDVSTTVILTSKQEADKDTVIIFHQNELFFLSPQCGFTLNYKIDTFSVTDNLIDSTYLVKDEITNFENGLIKIYL